MPFVIIVAVIAIALPLAIVWGIGKAIFRAISRPRREAEAQLQRDQRAQTICAYFERVNQSRAFPDVPVGLNLQLGEFALCDARARLFEYRAQRSRTGAAVRVAKGVYLGASQQHSHDELREVATGQLVATSQRIVYLSSQSTRTIKLTDILNIEEAGGVVEIHSAKRQKPVILSVEGFDAALLALLIKLCTAGKFSSRFIPEGMRLEPASDSAGSVWVNVRNENGGALVLPQ